MFDHPHFDRYAFEEIPLNRDLFLMDEIWMDEYEKDLVATFIGEEGEREPVGYISYAAARSVDEFRAEISWYPNTFDRFHEVAISLPRNQFITCVGCWRCDEKPHIFVKSQWLEHLHLQSYSVFALVDAIDVKEMLKKGLLTREMLIQLRDRIDILAGRYPDITFISFSDSLLLKSNWNVGQYDSEIEYNYAPEIFIQLITEIKSVYKEVLGLDVYAVLTQGNNAYYEDALTHTSSSGNHISLNALGLPFAQLMSIDNAAKLAIKRGTHNPAGLYMDKNFFNSLKFIYEFQKDTCGRNSYQEPLMGERGLYIFADLQHILGNLRNSKI